MKKTATLNLFEELCQKLSIIVKYDRFFGKGGYCRLRDKSYFIINERLSAEAKEQIFKKEMKALDIEDGVLPQKLKDLFDKKSS
ncbi:MAG: hypothetical protein JSW49_09540 [candidate division WOR-3 bacterium]|nr:MAG: hypothetical protein JSW49_09540 [candidate division WOR-3 bacterium]